MRKPLSVFGLLLLPVLVLLGCTQTSDTCPPEIGTAPVAVDALADGSQYPARFPLEEYAVGYFNVRDSSGVYTGKHHAAEDYYMPAGTPIYAVADGTVSYSGRMAGYGWLVIIDHPKVDVYSLYGHLSPSRWVIERGDVGKGELIAYIGDTDENGSSERYGTMQPHLHFGVRLGQRADYPGTGDNRWQAGWTYACPESIGWLRPSQFILDYAEGSFIVRSSPYAGTFGLYASYVLAGVWIAGLGCSTALAYGMTRRLEGRGIVSSGVVRRFVPWANIGRYKDAMVQKTGRPGGIYYLFLICLLIASLAALGLVAVLLIL